MNDLCFQIYNEMIRDLLNPSLGILDLREDAKGGVQVAGLSEVTARSTDEVSTRDTCIQYGHSGPTGGCQRWHAGGRTVRGHSKVN